MKRRAALLLGAFIAMLAAGCGGGSGTNESGPLLLVSSLPEAGLSELSARFVARGGRAVEFVARVPGEEPPSRIDLALVPSGDALLAAPAEGTLAQLHAWPLARAGAGAHHPEGLWVGVARTSDGLLAAAVFSESPVQDEARELVAFLLSDEGQALLGSIAGVTPLLTEPSDAQEP